MDKEIYEKEMLQEMIETIRVRNIELEDHIQTLEVEFDFNEKIQKIYVDVMSKNLTVEGKPPTHMTISWKP
jgi:hypothetical protein